ncbi:hypothetical protein C8F04DRAFT_1185713 [Mycena alexandri]|uniref:Uncharacterized protein n=1 Tax=Mycena alexandri TaxID=1745969 RepID=A0AAD6X1W3_9AGAR|nr:hypothetical protein C8F04DRAFT_1185713 [Mycena alexandri]
MEVLCLSAEVANKPGRNFRILGNRLRQSTDNPSRPRQSRCVDAQRDPSSNERFLAFLINPVHFLASLPLHGLDRVEGTKGPRSRVRWKTSSESQSDILQRNRQEKKRTGELTATGLERTGRKLQRSGMGNWERKPERTGSCWNQAGTGPAFRAGNGERGTGARDQRGPGN